jgi:mannitol/fructose-specific phosphotransferase system IIA component (Ntr-type)
VNELVVFIYMVPIPSSAPVHFNRALMELWRLIVWLQLLDAIMSSTNKKTIYRGVRATWACNAGPFPQWAGLAQ